MSLPTVSCLRCILIFVVALALLSCAKDQTGSTTAPTTELAATATTSGDGDTCSIAYNLPGDIGQFGADPPFQGVLDSYSWQLFLALNAPAVGQSVSTSGDNSTLWGASLSAPISTSNPGWSSTDDLLLAATITSTPPYGTHHYPTECQQVKNYQGYRVVDEISKVDDGFFEAGKIAVPNSNGVDIGLSSDPVVASNGTFLRYEILISPVTYSTIVSNQWYLSSVLAKQTSGLSFPCGTFGAGGSSKSPADPGIGAITMKNAWMDATGLSPSDYHMENLLVYTSGSQNSTGKPTCELKQMALVGMHIAHKTNLQNGWTWSTFEHTQNAPDCTSNPPAQAPGPSRTVPSTLCPAPDGTYNFFPSTAKDARFAACNQVPATNGTSACDDSWCVDLAPTSSGGYSQLCRQVPLETSDSAYSSAAQQSAACNQATGSSVWSNYTLISTQWFTSLDSSTSCANAASTVSPNSKAIKTYAPQVTLTGSVPSAQNPVPYLANTSMESYERANCMGCHSKAVINAQDNTSPNTDMMYFIMLEVPAAPVNSPSSTATVAKR